MMLKLPDKQREVLVMRLYMKMSFQEIAKETNVSINTALGRMRYALLALRKKIKLDHFIKHIYKLDKSSYKHIKLKSRYLQKIKPEIFIIFIKDFNTVYKYKSKTNHKYSYNETFLKWHIRLLFNPIKKGNNKNITINKKLIDLINEN